MTVNENFTKTLHNFFKQHILERMFRDIQIVIITIFVIVSSVGMFLLTVPRQLLCCSSSLFVCRWFEVFVFFI